MIALFVCKDGKSTQNYRLITELQIGLVIGQQYEISFEQSITRNEFSETGGFWRIKFGDETQESAQLLIPDAGIFEGLIRQTLFFTATQEIQSQLLTRLAFFLHLIFSGK